MPAYQFAEDVLWNYLREVGQEHKVKTQRSDVLCGNRLAAKFAGFWLGPDTLTRKVLNRQAVKKAIREWSEVLGPHSIRRTLAVGSAACNYAARTWDWELANPFNNHRIPLPEATPEILSYEDEAKLLAVAEPWMRDIIIFAVNTGLREDEILKLKWHQIDGDVISFAPKTQKSNRYGQRALNDAALEVLSRQSMSGEAVFPPISQGMFWWNWDKTRKRAGLSLKFHSLRATCGQRMLDAGAALEDIQAQLGHERIETTQKAYVRPSISRARRGVQLLRPTAVDKS